MVDIPKKVSDLERESLMAEWAWLKQRARYLAIRLGLPNPFPTRKESRQAQGRVDEDKHG